jgi:hypothetical protein
LKQINRVTIDIKGLSIQINKGRPEEFVVKTLKEAIAF